MPSGIQLYPLPAHGNWSQAHASKADAASSTQRLVYSVCDSPARMRSSPPAHLHRALRLAHRAGAVVAVLGQRVRGHLVGGLCHCIRLGSKGQKWKICRVRRPMHLETCQSFNVHCQVRLIEQWIEHSKQQHRSNPRPAQAPRRPPPACAAASNQINAAAPLPTSSTGALKVASSLCSVAGARAELRSRDCGEQTATQLMWYKR